MGTDPLNDDVEYEKPKRVVEDDDVYGAPDVGGVPDEEEAGAPVVERRRRPSSRWPLWALIGCVVVPVACCVLLICLLVVAGFGGAAVLRNSEAKTTDVQTVQIDTGEALTLVVDNPVGSVSVQPGAGDEVTVSATKKAYGITKGRAQTELDRIDVSITQPDAGTVQVQVDNARSDNNLFSFASSVELAITVPPSVSVTITNNVGSVTIDGVRALGVDVRSNTGSIDFNGSLDEQASDFSLQTNTGSIDVTLPPDTFVQIDAATDVGSVKVSNSFDTVNVTSSDDQGVDQSWVGVLGEGSGSAPKLRLRTNTGSIDVTTQ